MSMPSRPRPPEVHFRRSAPVRRRRRRDRRTARRSPPRSPSSRQPPEDVPGAHTARTHRATARSVAPAAVRKVPTDGRVSGRRVARTRLRNWTEYSVESWRLATSDNVSYVRFASRFSPDLPAHRPLRLRGRNLTAEAPRAQRADALSLVKRLSVLRPQPSAGHSRPLRSLLHPPARPGIIGIHRGRNRRFVPAT